MRGKVLDKKKRISIFYFLAVFIIYFSLDFRMIKMPFVFAEDAIFLNEAITDGFKSIIYRHAGYFELLPRLFANIAVFIGAIFNSYFCVKNDK